MKLNESMFLFNSSFAINIIDFIVETNLIIKNLRLLCLSNFSWKSFK